MHHPGQPDSIQNPYAPYQKEAFYCIFMDVIVAISLTLLLLLAGAGWFLLIILPLFAVCTFFINYRTVLQIRKEVKEEQFETATVEICQVKSTFSAAGYWGTILKEMLPKQLHAGRCTVLCRGENGQPLVLRCIMSESKQQLLRDGIDRRQAKEVSVTYGLRSHILLSYPDRGELWNAMNNKF